MSLQPTTNPFLDEVLADEPLVNGDVGAAQDEIVLRLQQLLPDTIPRFNAGRGLSGAKAISPLAPGDIRVAPPVLSDGQIGQVLVEVSVSTAPEGIGGVFRNQCALTISSIDGRVGADPPVAINWARAEAIRAVLYPFLDGCVNARGHGVWKSLVPLGYGPLRGDWAQTYCGSSATFTLVQAPSAFR